MPNCVQLLFIVHQLMITLDKNSRTGDPIQDILTCKITVPDTGISGISGGFYICLWNKKGFITIHQ